MASRYLVRDARSGACNFVQNVPLQILLDISDACGYHSAGGSATGTSHKCGRPLEQWQQVYSTELFEQLSKVEIPSPAALQLLNLISEHRICSVCLNKIQEDHDVDSYQRYCSTLTRTWQAKIWLEYLRVNGLQPEEYFEVWPGAFSLATWTAKVEFLKQNSELDCCKAHPKLLPKSTWNMKSLRQALTIDKNNAALAGRQRVVRAEVTGDLHEHETLRVSSPRERRQEGMISSVGRSDCKRPPLQRKPGTIKDLGAWPLDDSRAGRDGLPAEPKTPERPILRTNTTDDALSPESVPSSGASSVFDFDEPGSVETPLNQCEIPSDRRGTRPIANRYILSNNVGAQEYTPTKRKPRRNDGGLHAGKQGSSTPPTKAKNTVHTFGAYKTKIGLLGGLGAMEKKMNGKTCAPGYIYCFRHEQHPGFVKIGHVKCKEIKNITKKDKETPFWRTQYYSPVSHSPNEIPEEVRTRYVGLKSACGYDIIHVFSYAMPCAAEKMESLIHAELNAQRRCVENCNPLKKKHRNAKHDEWFEITEEAAEETVRRWQRFSERRPYGNNGKLTRPWQDAVDEDMADKHLRIQSLAVWVEQQIAQPMPAEEGRGRKHGSTRFKMRFTQADVIASMKRATTWV